MKEVEKTQSSFSLENEVCKIKIPIHFFELLHNAQYKERIMKMGKGSETDQTSNINAQDSLTSQMILLPFYLVPV